MAAREYAAVFEEHRKVFEFTCTWSFEKYTGKKRCGLVTGHARPYAFVIVKPATGKARSDALLVQGTYRGCVTA